MPAPPAGGGGFSFSGGSGGASAPAAFGSANKGLYKQEDVTLVTAADVEPIAKAVKAMSAETLILKGAAVDCDESATVHGDAAKALAEMFSSCAGSLKRVVLCDHRFDSPETLRQLLSGLSGNVSLEELDMTNSSLGADGGMALASVICGCSSLRSLSLEDCMLEEAGCAAVVGALAELSKLEELDLRNNDMEADSVSELALSLGNMPALRCLRLDEDLEEALDPVIDALRTLDKGDALVLGDDDDDDDDGEGEDDSSPSAADASSASASPFGAAGGLFGSKDGASAASGGFGSTPSAGGLFGSSAEAAPSTGAFGSSGGAASTFSFAQPGTALPSASEGGFSFRSPPKTLAPVASFSFGVVPEGAPDAAKPPAQLAAAAKPPAVAAASSGSAPVSAAAASSAGAPRASAPSKTATEDLYNAAEMGDHEALLKALKDGANVDHVDVATTKTALHWASQCGRPEDIKALLKAGASLDVKTKAGVTPLIFAASQGWDDCVPLLLEGGANKALETNKGRTALAAAKEKVAKVDAEEKGRYEKVVKQLSDDSVQLCLLCKEVHLCDHFCS